ncbi:MAG: dual specificity protein phosphatase family protein [Deltaproteobacteria bacterium]|nr:dual specificity protein phosphatase family protein [Deltaproteobacteria bacterium]
MNKIILNKFFVFGLFVAAQCPFLISDSFAAIRNFGQVDDLIYRGARLRKGDKGADYKELADLGIGTILNLERFNSDDEGFCNKNGLTSVRFPLILLGLPDADKFFDYTVLEEAFQFLVDEVQKGHKVYIHCYYGKDRTGSLVSAWNIRKNACGKERYNKDDKDALWKKVEDDLTAYGFHDDLYPTLKNSIRAWVYELPSWICAPPTSEDQH